MQFAIFSAKQNLTRHFFHDSPFFSYRDEVELLFLQANQTLRNCCLCGTQIAREKYCHLLVICRENLDKNRSHKGRVNLWKS